jgi:asparagine synthase (glutamine-hydrolysing)
MMCGIAGLVRFDGKTVGGRVDRMVATLRHRGPDDAGTAYFDTVRGVPVGTRAADADEANAGLGLARLSIIDLSPAGHQPMANEDGTVWISFNGEVYNFGEVRPWLMERRHRFRSRTDTEVLLHAYEEEGLGCLERFRGMFGMAILDLPKRRLFLARDRLGLKPVKYVATDAYFAFASELKALCALPEVSRRLDPLAVEEYLAYRYVPAPRTGLEGIQKLPPASILELDLTTGKHRISSFWAPPHGSTLPRSDEEVLDEAQKRFDEAVALRLIADVPVGVFLSGGLDSSAVVASAARVQQDLRTYSVGFEDPRFDELTYARQVAQRFGTRHHELVVRPAIGEDLEAIVRAFDEPFADPSAVPSFYLAKATAAHVRVALNGDGGDELFGGYKRYHVHRRTWAWQRWLPARRGWLAPAVSAFAFEVDKKRWRGKLRRLILEASLPYGRAYQLRFSGMDARMREAIEAPWLRERTWGYDPLDRLARAFAALPDRSPETSLQDVDLVGYLPNDILVKSDLAGMAHSLEARSPFLDHRFVEFALQLPQRWRTRQKFLLRRMLADALPPGLLNRKKMGFNPPIEGWIRGELSGIVQEALLGQDAASASLFDRQTVRTMVDRHLTGRGNLGELIWQLLVLEVWIRSFRVTL